MSHISSHHDINIRRWPHKVISNCIISGSPNVVDSRCINSTECIPLHCITFGLSEFHVCNWFKFEAWPSANFLQTSLTEDTLKEQMSIRFRVNTTKRAEIIINHSNKLQFVPCLKLLNNSHPIDKTSLWNWKPIPNDVNPSKPQMRLHPSDVCFLDRIFILTNLGQKMIFDTINFLQCPTSGDRGIEDLPMTTP